MSLRVRADDLARFVRELFCAYGLGREEGRSAAEALCYGDLVGHGTHGVANLERVYLPRLADGRIDPRAMPEVVSDSGATALVDGRHGLGLVVATIAMDLAIAKARSFGAGLVSVRCSSHFGCAGYYASRALGHGMIGLASTNLGAQRIARPPSGLRPLLGTNPIAVAAPTERRHPFVLDMSTTAVSAGKVREAQRRGERVPPGWLVDDDGAPVTDPARLDDATAHLAWPGGYKGYGLAVLVDLLCGILSGAAVGPDLSQPSEDRDVGHVFLAIDVARFRPAREFRAALDRMLETLLACPAADGSRVLYPGYLEHERLAERLREGAPLDRDVYASLEQMAEDAGLAPPAVVVEEVLA